MPVRLRVINVVHHERIARRGVAVEELIVRPISSVVDGDQLPRTVSQFVDSELV